MLLGMFVPSMPYPRLGLGAHINIMSTGILSLGTGLILYQPNLVSLSSPHLQLVRWGFYSSVLVIGSEILNAWWGTKEFLSLVSYLFCVFWGRGKGMWLTRDIGGSTSRCPRRDAFSGVCYVLDACCTVFVVDFGCWECGLAFSFWESAGREGEAVRGVVRRGFLCVCERERESNCIVFRVS
jgi:hypothetical protein